MIEGKLFHNNTRLPLEILVTSQFVVKSNLMYCFIVWLEKFPF